MDHYATDGLTLKLISFYFFLFLTTVVWIHFNCALDIPCDSKMKFACCWQKVKSELTSCHFHLSPSNAAASRTGVNK